jgi:hypothetical protein
MASLTEIRSDPDEAGRLVERLLQEPARAMCLAQLAESIRTAHQVSPASWGVTLHESEIRLNVGWLEALVLRTNELGLTIDKTGASDDDWLEIETAPGLEFKPDGQPFASMASAYGIEASADVLEALLPKLRHLHLAHVEKAAKGVRTRGHFHSTHSPGVIEYLRQTVTTDLPDPDYGTVELPPSSSKRRYWKINPGKGAKYWTDFKQRQMIAIGWDERVDLRALQATSELELKQRLEAHPDKGDYPNRDHGAKQLWRFYHDMQVGDLVCTYGKSAVLGWGVITGEYEHEPLQDMAHQRSVDWQSTQPQSISDLPGPLAATLSHQHTVLPLTREDFAQITKALPHAPFEEVGDVPESVGEFDSLTHALKSRRLSFSSEILSNYLLALQTKRFVILTGISGTGKTQLALAIANHFRQLVSIPQTSQLPDGALAVTVRPYSLKYGHMVLPTSFTANLVHPPAGRFSESRQIRVEYPEGEQKLTLSKDADRNVTNLFFKGAFRNWFRENFAEGNQFAIELLDSDDGTSDALRIHVPTVVQQTERLRNHVVAAVRPDWSDNRGLLGYFNPLIGTYVITPFLRLLLDAQAEVDRAEREGREPAPFFVILDEMNLARVEHYFSDFLSALESSEPIHLHDHPGIEEGETEDAIPVPRSLHVPPNVFFTGTVNVDETTYMFSPKVLDRAFTIELNRVELETFGSEQMEEIGAFTLTRFVGSLGTARKPNRADWVEFGELLDGAMRQVVLDIHTLLDEEDRHFGYRVANEIARFMLLAHEQTDGSDESLWTALDLAVLQKILPKFHGTQQELEEILTRLSEFVASLPLPRTAAKLQSMQRRLKRQGFTSFIE